MDSNSRTDHSPHNSSFLKLLCSHTVSHLTESPKEVIEIVSETPLVTAFEKLFVHKLTCVPVWDSNKKGYIGFLEVRDLVSFVVFASEQMNNFNPFSSSFLTEVLKNGLKRFRNRNLDTVSVRYLARRNVFKPVHENATIFDVASILAHNHIQRVPILNKEGKCINIITQSSVIQFFEKHKELLNDDLDQTLDEMGLAHKDVVSVTADTITLDTFKTMDQAQLSGLAIVDRSAGKMVGNTTSSDLKYVVSNCVKANLTLPILEFLKQIRPESYNVKSSCFPSATLGKTISYLAGNHLHSVFTISKHERPIGVVSITDLLRFCTSNKPQVENFLELDEICHNNHCPVCINQRISKHVCDSSPHLGPDSPTHRYSLGRRNSPNFRPITTSPSSYRKNSTTPPSRTSSPPILSLDEQSIITPTSTSSDDSHIAKRVKRG